jgi:hypothetical protein
MKNEHIVYAYAPLLEGGGKCLLIVGITDVGWEYLKQEGGNFLTARPPAGAEFSNVADVWIVRGKDKADVRTMLETVARQNGITLTTAH